MKLEEVLPALREGKKIAQACWKDEAYMMLVEGFLVERFVKTGKTSLCAYFHKTCMLADDWEVLDED